MEVVRLQGRSGKVNGGMEVRGKQEAERKNGRKRSLISYYTNKKSSHIKWLLFMRDGCQSLLEFFEHYSTAPILAASGALVGRSCLAKVLSGT